MKKKDRAELIFEKLSKIYPDAHCELHHQSPFQLLIATILSAQCTDEQVNKVTPKLFHNYPDCFSMANAPLQHIEKLIYSTCFYKNKSKNIIKCAQTLTSEYKGIIPADLQKLIKLPGVGRKTGNVLLGNAFNINEGIVVDTHVKRLSTIFKFTKQSNPVKIEQDLVKLFPQKHWTIVSHLLIFHGRRFCNAKKPLCSNCLLGNLCPQFPELERKIINKKQV